MKEKKWRLILKWENIPIGVTLLMAVTITILKFLGIVGDNLVNSTILLVLISLSYQLLYTYIVLTKLKNQIEYPSIINIFKPYKVFVDEIRLKLTQENEVWLLARTGRGFIEKEYKKEFDYILKKGKARFLFINPENGALRMIENTIEEDYKRVDVRYSHQKGYIGFLNEVTKRCSNRCQLKIINHLPAWTLVIFNPKKKNEHSVIYVELGSYRSEVNYRPAFKITPQDGESFNRFINEFEEMWKDAKKWQPQDIPEI